AREMALEELLVDGDVLDGDEPASGIVLDNRVNQRGGVPVAEAVDESVDVDQGADNVERKTSHVKLTFPSEVPRSTSARPHPTAWEWQARERVASAQPPPARRVWR